MSEVIEYPGVRCFRRERTDGKRCGIWIMTRPSGYRGAFFHGTKCEIQPPDWTVEALAEMYPEITPAEAISEMDNGWPEAKAEMLRIFARHGVTV